jgi:hypothetical protein
MRGHRRSICRGGGPLDGLNRLRSQGRERGVMLGAVGTCRHDTRGACWRRGGPHHDVRVSSEYRCGACSRRERAQSGHVRIRTHISLADAGHNYAGMPATAEGSQHVPASERALSLRRSTRFGHDGADVGDHARGRHGRASIPFRQVRFRASNVRGGRHDARGSARLSRASRWLLGRSTPEARNSAVSDDIDAAGFSARSARCLAMNGRSSRPGNLPTAPLWTSGRSEVDWLLVAVRG